MSTITLKNRINKLPKTPGVYEFHDKQGKILYIGKATNLRDRVGSYFRDFSKTKSWGTPRLSLERGSRIEQMISQIADIKFHETDSVLEALILESNLIKKHQPKYNIEGKDDKSFVQVVITKENFPRVLVDRIQNSKFKIQNDNAKFKNYLKTFGPYTSRKQLEIALKLIRKIFPYHSAKQISRNCCFEHQIGLCPGLHAGAISRKDYLKNIRGVKMILEGKKKSLVSALKKEMKAYAKKNEFEKAAEVRNRIFALEHIRDVALISEDMPSFGHPMSKKDIGCLLRIEGYDISNIGGDYAVGSMVVFTNGKADKNEYRKFKIKTIQGIDDVGMMREVLYRRFHNSWPKPDLILLDGGKGHLDMAQRILRDRGLEIPIIAVAKGPTRKKLDIYQSKFLLTYLGRNEEIREKYNRVLSDVKLLERIRNEAHRFAINYHKKLRKKNWKEK